MRRRILIVDDEPIVRAIIARLLEEEGYDVTEVSDAPRALAAARAAAPPFDLVITDNLMPGMSGRRLLDELRAEWPDLAVVLISGLPLVDPLPPGDRLRRLEKPVLPERLYTVVRELLGPTPAHDRGRPSWPGFRARSD
ncbi:MAG TPA: response regulator [Gemmatimonadales bacterium]|nr:response regulator [Gemmatimonadales bacterium]